MATPVQTDGKLLGSANSTSVGKGPGDQAPVVVNQTLQYVAKAPQASTPVVPPTGALPQVIDAATLALALQMVAQAQSARSESALKLAEGAYVGESQGGKPHGYGTLNYNSDNTRLRYEGHFKEGVRSGQGKTTLRNGDVYQGEFANDAMNGPGTYVSGDGTSRYKGTFKNGEYDGQGQLVTKDWTYTGQFEKGCACGRGELILKSGTVFRGQFKGDVVHGQATEIVTMTNTRGFSWEITYEGTYENGKRHGRFKVTGFGNQVSYKNYVNDREDSCVIL